MLIRERVIRAIEIEKFMQSEECKLLRSSLPKRPNIVPLVLGTTLPREEVYKRIAQRLKERLDNGMIEEVEQLHNRGNSWERLEKLGLEYRYVSFFLENKINDKDTLFDELYRSICHFAKRQETWFRGMEKKGVAINWLPSTTDINTRFNGALRILEDANIMR